ncbi:hypothetical protein [Methanoregula sp.]|uniref:hypothetical protein n=1 Tax=Methanoregula sp. TaxID=2052170 RepID=UPI003BAE448F
MVENEPDKNITLWCERLDPTNPDMLSCEIIPNPVPTNKGLVPDASLKTPLPDQAGADAAKPSSGGSSDAKAPGYEKLTVLRCQKDGEEYLKILKPGDEPAQNADAAPLIQEPPVNATETQKRVAQSNGCDDKHCVVSRLALARQRNAPKREGRKGDRA